MTGRFLHSAGNLIVLVVAAVASWHLNGIRPLDGFEAWLRCSNNVHNDQAGNSYMCHGCHTHSNIEDIIQLL